MPDTIEEAMNAAPGGTLTPESAKPVEDKVPGPDADATTGQ